MHGPKGSLRSSDGYLQTDASSRREALAKSISHTSHYHLRIDETVPSKRAVENCRQSLLQWRCSPDDEHVFLMRPLPQKCAKSEVQPSRTRSLFRLSGGAVSWTLTILQSARPPLPHSRLKSRKFVPLPMRQSGGFYKSVDRRHGVLN